MFEIVNATCGYRKTIIVRDASMRADSGEIVALLGRNGVGKTTLLKYAMGLVNVFGGSLSLDGRVLPDDTANRARNGLGYVPQGRFVFPRLTVAENIAVPAIACGKDHKKAIERALSDFPILAEKANALAGGLSGGQQQILAIARALAIDPKVLLLDEPTEGVQPSIVDDIADTLRTLLRQHNLTIIVAEQNLDFCLSLAQRVYIMDQGMIARETTKDLLLNDTDLIHELLAV